MTKCSAIILAAGLSRRMGARNKLLLQVNDIPMIRHMVQTYSAVATDVIVVTGHEAKKIEAALAGTDVKFVFNPDFAQGQRSSVVCGLRAVAADRSVLMGLGDQPHLTADDLRALIDAHQAADPARISIPMAQGQRGNPILIPTTLRARLLADRTSPGCKKFTRAHPEHVQFHQLNAAGFYADVDTPEDYSAITKDHLEVTR